MERSMPFHSFLLGNNHMRVANNIKVKLELHLVVGYQYFQNNQGLYIPRNRSDLCRIFPLDLLLRLCHKHKHKLLRLYLNLLLLPHNLKFWGRRLKSLKLWYNNHLYLWLNCNLSLVPLYLEWLRYQRVWSTRILVNLPVLGKRKWYNNQGYHNTKNYNYSKLNLSLGLIYKLRLDLVNIKPT